MNTYYLSLLIKAGKMSFKMHNMLNWQFVKEQNFFLFLTTDENKKIMIPITRFSFLRIFYEAAHTHRHTDIYIYIYIYIYM